MRAELNRGSGHWEEDFVRSRSGPGSKAKALVFSEGEDVIGVAAELEAFFELVTIEEYVQSPGGEVSGLRIVGLGSFGLISIANQTEMILCFIWIRSIIAPVVPDRKRYSIRNVRQHLAHKHSALFLFTHAAPNRRIAPFAGDDGNFTLSVSGYHLPQPAIIVSRSFRIRLTIRVN